MQIEEGESSALHQLELEQSFISQDPVSFSALYMLRSFYECPMIVECISLLFKCPCYEF